jgi:hypothetical protein
MNLFLFAIHEKESHFDMAKPCMSALSEKLALNVDFAG